jgi:hypothetical protein
MNTVRFFVGAAILGAGVALKFGAPVMAVALGVLAAGWFNRQRTRRAWRPAAASVMEEHVKRTLVAAVLSCAVTAGPAMAQGSATAPNSGAIKLTAGLDVPSVYYFRGIRQEQDPEATLWPYGDVGITLMSAENGLRSVGVNLGTWNSLHTGSSGSQTPGRPMHYEEDFYSSVILGFSPATVSAKYIAYTSPNLSYATIQEVDVQLTGTQTFAPYGLVAFELSDKGQADAGGRKGTYLEVGAGPHWPLGRATLSVPISVGVSLRDYYETADADHRFGFFDAGAMITVPVGGAAKVGSWNIHGRVDWLRLGDGTVAVAGNNGRKNQCVVVGGIGLSY